MRTQAFSLLAQRKIIVSMLLDIVALFMNADGFAGSTRMTVKRESG